MPSRDYFEMGPSAFEEDSEGIFPENIAERIWNRDTSLWNGPPDEIANRLGWLALPEKTAAVSPEIERFAAGLRSEGVRRAVVVGMGGSALMSKVFGRAFDAVKLTVADTTVPDSLAALRRETDFSSTFFIVSSKSGATVETSSVSEWLFEVCSQKLGGAQAARRFCAITDPRTPLFENANRKGFLRVFEGDTTVGGRFSPLSVFGMFPAALAGADTGAMLKGADLMSRSLRRNTENTALRLAAAIGLFCDRANGKFHVCCSEGIAGFDRFVEQIVGESLGKDGKKVFPVAHPLFEWEETGGAVFVCLKGDSATMALAKQTARRGVPVVMTVVDGPLGLCGEVFRWEFAVAALGTVWGVNPFDQPDVEGAKAQARRFLKIHRSKGKLPFGTPDFEKDGIEFRGLGLIHDEEELRVLFKNLASAMRDKGYICIQSFLDGGDLRTRRAVEALRGAVSKKFQVTVTSDWGPAYLHSSGQTHKGGGTDGLFIQLGGGCASDIKIPDSTPDSGGLSFEILKNAQMLGDMEAIRGAGRKAVQIMFSRRAGEKAGAVSKAAGLLGVSPY